MLPAQTTFRAARRVVTSTVDDTRLVTLHGTVHPLAQQQYDEGPLPDSFQANRQFLVLQRPSDRQASLVKFLQDVEHRGSPEYHRWLTPEEFGKRFGPADADIQATVGWLQSHGLSVGRITRAKTVIEFSGTAGQIRDAFHTQIHQYSVNRQTHYANANDIRIPAALAPLVRGVMPLNDFSRAKPYVSVSGPALYSPTTKRATPLWTIPNPFGTPNPYAYPVAPEDLATQYDLAPLYQAGLNGAGQTIGIINESNIDLTLVSAYQQLFGLTSNLPQVVIDGNDPGDLAQVDVEAYLDVEVSGAVAQGANVNLYISNGSAFQDPVALAALRAVEDNQASVLSVSFGECEQFLGNAGNQFWSGLWEQAAAQGQTVFVAAGDTGPECNFGLGVSVSGFASTPWNVAVGGTDFYYSDYASGGASATTLWNQTNDSNLGSLTAPLPEQAWNDGFGLDVIANGAQRGEFFSGGGGASSCSTVDPYNGGCVSGYGKPNWQTGPGVPGDGVRDLPDVSLFASNGANLSAYPICAYPGECVQNGAGQMQILLVGGTSASSPAMAGIMALIDQKYGRQGQANFKFYSLAQQVPAAFHDITLGSNTTICFSGTTDCSNGVTTVYNAGPGYDLATGLGSVDANVLLNNWNSTTPLATTTTLHLSSRQIKHGTPVTVTASVAPSSGSGTPSGDVAVLTSSTLPSNQAQTFIPLSGGAGSQSVNFFPGGTYLVTGQYGGDAVYGESTSSAVPLTVTPENSNINFSVQNGQSAIANGGNLQYNSPLALLVQPTGVSASAGKTNGIATGTATFTVDSSSATVAVNGAGVASWTPPALALGNHTASATYSGDASFNGSSSKAVTFTVTKGVPYVRDYVNGPIATSGLPGIYVNVGGSLSITVQVGPFYGPLTGLTAPLGTVGPTGTVTVCLGGNFYCSNPTYSQTVTLSSPNGTYSQYATATATFTNLAAGYYVGGILYNGDANWQSQQLDDIGLENIVVGTQPALAASMTGLSITPASISGAQLATLTTTVTGSSSKVPTGEVDYYDNGVFLTYAIISPQNSGSVVSFSFPLNSSWFWNNGANQITAIYDGDSNYLPSTSATANIMVAQNGGDFSLAPQIPQVTVNAGSSTTIGLNLASIRGFNGIVNLSCAPSSANVTCSVNPSALTVNGSATATVTIGAAAGANAAIKRSAGVFPGLPGSAIWLSSAGMFAFGVFWMSDCKRRRKRLVALSFGLLGLLAGFVACGGSQQSQQQQQQPPPAAAPTTYSVLVGGNANGINHNAKVIVMVP